MISSLRTQTTVALNDDLSQVSLYFIYFAMALYTVAFLAYVWHLSQASSTLKKVRRGASKIERGAFFLLVFAAVFHGTGVILRGVAASRVPWANMYEFSITGTFLVVAIYLVSWFFVRDIRILAVFLSGFVLLVLGIATTVFYVEVKSLMPALQSYWLVIHVTVAILATGFFNIASAASIAYLMKGSKLVETSKLRGLALTRRILALFPDMAKLEKLAYRFNIIGFILWTFTLIAGAIWAERAWHRYWGWDTKEVWTFIIWTIYAGYLHANATRGWSGKRSAWLAVIGFSAIIFNFTIVNLFFKGLHVYSGLK
ncbi:MAG: c-type cytochrome biosis protein CcsB [Actinomycetota bacterium]|jgi:cytochrome c-type biogenesis protein CcsB